MLSYEELYPAPQSLDADAVTGQERTTEFLRRKMGLDPVAGNLVTPQAPRGIRELRSHVSTGLGLVDSVSTAERFRSALMRGTEISDLPPAEYLIDGVWPARAVSDLYGPSGHAKSLIGLSMGASIAHGRAWCGHPVKAGVVVYVAAEGASGQGARLKAWMSRYNVPDVPGLVWLPMAVNLTSAVDVAALIEATRPLDPDAFILDTQARCTVGADENSARDMGVMVAACDRIVSELESAVLLIHHAGKDTSAGLRGSTAVLGAMDAVLSVRRDGDRVDFSIEKMKNGPDDVRHTFRLEAYEDSVVPVEVVAGGAGDLPDQTAKMLALLDELDEGNGVASGSWKRSAGVPDTSFHRYRKNLMGAGLCQQGGTQSLPRYSLTTKGREALGLSGVPEVPGGFQDPAERGTTTPTSLERWEVVPPGGPDSDRSGA
jgi:RecA-family ATPase